MPPVETATANRPSESRATAPTVSAPSISSWRFLSVMKIEGSHISIPCSRAKREAPSPASRTCLPSRMTATARSIGWRTSFSPATPPARKSAPSITPASSSTTPSAFRQAPMPALSSGSSSRCRTAASAAERAPEPIWDQPASRARSTAACRSGRSTSGTGPAPPWTISAGRALLGPVGAAVDHAAFGDAPVERVEHAAAGVGSRRVSALGKPPLHPRTSVAVASLRSPRDQRLRQNHTFLLREHWSVMLSHAVVQRR